MKVEED